MSSGCQRLGMVVAERRFLVEPWRHQQTSEISHMPLPDRSLSKSSVASDLVETLMSLAELTLDRLGESDRSGRVTGARVGCRSSDSRA